MECLSLNDINRNAPYCVVWHEKSHTYRFRSRYDVVFAISFDEDEIIENIESYVFSIVNVNNVPLPRDANVRDTVMLIIENFFNVNQAALLYICESGDGKQLSRGRLFEFWFSSYRLKDEYLLMPVNIEDTDGIENVAALVVRKDNPNFINIVTEFSNTVAMLKVKPNGSNL